MIVKSPNGWSCVACAFANLLSVPLGDLLKQVGHDGSQIISDDLAEPLCRRGFHTQEFTKIAYGLGYVFSQWNLEPLLSPFGDYNHLTVIDHRDFVQDLISKSQGIMLGQGVLHAHTVAWSGSHYICSSHGILSPGSNLFTPHTYLMMSPR